MIPPSLPEPPRRPDLCSSCGEPLRREIIGTTFVNRCGCNADVVILGGGGGGGGCTMTTPRPPHETVHPVAEMPRAPARHWRRDRD